MALKSPFLDDVNSNLNAVKQKDMINDLAELKGFLPFQMVQYHGHPMVAWSDFRDTPLQEPFFAHDVFHRPFRPNPRFVLTPWEILLQNNDVLSGLKPSGFIFHTSSCGSTLITNMLRANPRIISLSEPNILYDILSRSAGQDPDLVAGFFRNVVLALGQKPLGTEEYLVIKFTSPATVFLPMIMRAFPDVPRVFLYRDPVEVLVANMRKPGQEWFYQESIIGLDNITLGEINTPLENCAIALQRKMESFLKHSDGNHLIANYSQLSPELFSRILKFFEISVSPSEMDLMLSVDGDHSHRRGTAFAPDSDQKQNAASQNLRDAANRYLGSLYQQLEALRIKL